MVVVVEGREHAMGSNSLHRILKCVLRDIWNVVDKRENDEVELVEISRC